MLDLTANNDDALLLLMADNDQEAFTALYKRYWESLFITTVKVIRSKEDAADIVQEVFVALWRRRHELSLNTGSLAAYLQTSVKYKAISYIEKNITRRNYLELLAGLTTAGASPLPEVLLQVKQTQELIQTVINNMPAKMQRVYQLSRQEQLSHKEIAILLNISEETVKKHIQHALQLIRAALGQTSLSLAMLLVEWLW